MRATNKAADELHPSMTARMIRSMRALRIVRGWQRLVTKLVPIDTSGSFIVANPTGLFAGDISSFIDRNMYLFGEYEGASIREFMAKVPMNRRGTILDIGANVGTHSLAFAQHFEHVHAFEPNPALWENFKKNMALNGLSNVHLHKIGLGDADAELPFYLIDKKNYGLGTVSSSEQYDLPLKPAGCVKIFSGEQYLTSRKIGSIDAVKIDVQGFELEVLRGLSSILQKDEPFVWLEVSADTKATLQLLSFLRAQFPFQSTIFRFKQSKAGFFRSVRLQLATEELLDLSDYVVAPAKDTRGRKPNRC